MSYRGHMDEDEQSLDELAVFKACALAQSERREIEHGTARTIAAWYAGGNRAEQAFVSTGAITDSATYLWRLLTDQGTLYTNAPASQKLALDMLGTYLLNREDHGPVEGWSDMWVR